MHIKRKKFITGQTITGRRWEHGMPMNLSLIHIFVIIVIAAISGGGDDKDKNPQKVSQTPSDDKQTSSENKKTDDTETCLLYTSRCV